MASRGARPVPMTQGRMCSPTALVSLSEAAWWNPMLAVLATLVHGIVGTGYIVGAWRSLRNRFANMDVLVALGSTTAYVYSMASLLLGCTLA